MTLLTLIPPLFVSLIGALVGAALSGLIGFNVYAAIAAFSYVSVLVLLLVFTFFDTESRPHSAKEVLFGIALYFVVATCTWPYIAAAAWKMRQLEIL